MKACRHQTGHMSHINHQVSTDHIGNLTETLVINETGVSTGAGHDDLRLHLFGDPFDFIIVDHLAFFIDAIAESLIVISREA